MCWSNPQKKKKQHLSQSPGVFRASHVGNTMSCSEHPTRRNQCAWPDSWAKKVDIQIKRPKLTYKVGPRFSYKLVYNPYKWPYRWITEGVTLVINGVILPISREPTEGNQHESNTKKHLRTCLPGSMDSKG